jgi:hypothetical protein
LRDGQEDETYASTEPKSAEDEKNADATPEDSARPLMSTSPEAAVKFAGSYTHHAYGTFDVSHAGASILSVA